MLTAILSVVTWGWTCDLLSWLCGGCGTAERRAAREREIARKAEIHEYYREAGVEYHG